MPAAWPLIVAALLLDGLAGLAGGVMSEDFLGRHRLSLIGFAAGALLTAAFLDILPAALSSGVPALPLAFAAMLVLVCMEWALGHQHLYERGGRTRGLPVALLSSDALHNVGDGAAVAASLIVSWKAGLGTAMAVLAHELPQEVGDYAVLRAAGMSKGRALAGLALVQLTAFIGAAGVVLLSAHLARLNGVVLAIAAGTFIHIAATDLLPELLAPGAGRTRGPITGFLAGVALLSMATLLQG